MIPAQLEAVLRVRQAAVDRTAGAPVALVVGRAFKHREAREILHRKLRIPFCAFAVRRLPHSTDGLGKRHFTPEDRQADHTDARTLTTIEYLELGQLLRTGKMRQ